MLPSLFLVIPNHSWMVGVLPGVKIVVGTGFDVEMAFVIGQLPGWQDEKLEE